MSAKANGGCFAPIAVAINQIVVADEIVFEGIDLDTGRQTVVSIDGPPLASPRFEGFSGHQLAGKGLVLMISIHQVRASR